MHPKVHIELFDNCWVTKSLEVSELEPCTLNKTPVLFNNFPTIKYICLSLQSVEPNIRPPGVITAEGGMAEETTSVPTGQQQPYTIHWTLSRVF